MRSRPCLKHFIIRNVWEVLLSVNWSHLIVLFSTLIIARAIYANFLSFGWLTQFPGIITAFPCKLNVLPAGTRQDTPMMTHSPRLDRISLTRNRKVSPSMNWIFAQLIEGEFVSSFLVLFSFSRLMMILKTLFQCVVSKCEYFLSALIFPSCSLPNRHH